MLRVYFNVDGTDQPFGVSGIEFLEFSEGNDTLLFSNGSDQVQEGADIPTQAELISAGVILTGVEIIVPGYFIADVSANQVREIALMGNVNARYVWAFDFDAATASEPVLEFWDDSNVNTITSTMLGGGTPSQSFVRGITTTSATSGADWVGSKLAGSGAGNFLYLNDQNGPLTVADTLYAQLKIIIPASQTTGFSGNPVFCIKWLEN